MNEEENLELLIDSCRKTIATAVGNGHKEYVLYKNKKTNEYELHRYILNPGSQHEAHKYITVDEKVCSSLMTLIEELNLETKKDILGFGLCGGDYVCKFKKGDEYIRITTANYNGENYGDLIKIMNAMAAYFADHQ